ncbi:hypothetical protein NX85_17845 [Aeromonas salmonicida subsp. salmonicida]|uniref:hypothetical protein n=1 Tax=Aeromonas salmonicida TaxID=645 RepID=UPI000542CF7D|nr:hypothetical protein [Aeromonas salmonicida]KHE97409.1 hypothetical protein NX85_17845 [Aeromonas salmonicida subsp. salmonicida]
MLPDELAPPLLLDAAPLLLELELDVLPRLPALAPWLLPLRLLLLAPLLELLAPLLPPLLPLLLPLLLPFPLPFAIYAPCFLMLARSPLVRAPP